MPISFKEHTLLIENKVEWLKNNAKDFDTDFDTLATHRDKHAIIDHWASADPHPKKANTQWVVNQYRKQNIRQEDHPGVKDALEGFEKYKGKLEKKDINQYKDLGELTSSLQPHYGTAASAKQEKKGMGALVHDGGDFKVFKIRTPEEATHFSKEAPRATGVPGKFGKDGATAAWCTVHPDTYNGYAKPDHNGVPTNPLYIIHSDKAEGLKKRYQIDFNSGQYMNGRDENQGLGALIAQHPGIRGIDAFKGKHPLLEKPEEFNSKIASGHAYPGWESAIKQDHQTRSLTADTLEKARQSWTNRQVDAEKHLSAIAGHPNASPQTLTHLHEMGKNGNGIGKGLAANPSTPEHILHHYAKMHNTAAEVAGNVGASQEVLHSIASTANGTASGTVNSAHEAVAKNPKAAEHTIQHMITVPGLHKHLLENPSVNTDHISQIHDHAMAHSKGIVKSTTEEAIAVHPNTHPDILHKLALGENHIARSKALNNPKTSDETKQAAFDTGIPAIHAALSKSVSTPRHLLDDMAGRKEPAHAFIAKTAAETIKKIGK